MNRATVMPVASVAGFFFKPVVVLPGRQEHYRRVNGVAQSLHDVLPPCYLYQRDIPGVELNIFYDWAANFIEEAREIRRQGR